MEEPSEFDQVEYPEVTRIAEAFPGCAVMPLSRLTVNDTGVNNGDITFFWTSFNVRVNSGFIVCLLYTSDAADE